MSQTKEIKEIKLEGKYVLVGKIKLETGLHIGTSKDTMKIGDLDNPIIKDASGRPYIPGSSLKGKMRYLMEYSHELISSSKLVYSRKNENQPIRIHLCEDPSCKVCGLFGNTASEQTSVEGKKINIAYKVPTRIIVRDSHLIEESITEEMRRNLDFEYTEIKHENTIDRILSTANPRQTERVPAGAKFDLEIIVNKFCINNDKEQSDGTKFIKELFIAMKLLEDDYLGGSGSRGYGKVKFEDLVLEFRDINYYSQENTSSENSQNSIKKIEIKSLKNISDILNEIDKNFSNN